MEAESEHEDPYRSSSIADLVAGARDGDERAWDEIVRRHTALVLARVREFRLSPQHAEDVAQTVWLNLLEHLDRLREPEALPGWISTTTRSIPVDPQGGRLDAQVTTDMDQGMVEAERYRALRDGLAELPAHQRELLVLLSSDPPLSYAEISARLGLPVGSIGPTRSRGLARLRRTTAISSYLASLDGAALGEGERHVLALG
jgi:RNA polymerase sigma factor (sigma-70 family)